MRRQVWRVGVRDHDGYTVCCRDFSDGTSEENYEAASAEYQTLLGYRYFGFNSAPFISMEGFVGEEDE